jgi:hypothetical protein
MHLAEHSFDVPSIGKQDSSQKPTAPAHSFGSCSRDRQHHKVFLSEDHETRKATMYSPGPVYSIPSAVGEGPSYGFGTAPQRHHGRAKYPDTSVDLTGATVDSQSCKFHATKGVVFGTEQKAETNNTVLLKTHPQAHFGKESPGPTAYTPRDKDVTRQTEPRYSLGEKTKILSTKAQTPRNVGPGSYPPTASMGEQPSSAKKSMPSWSFGNSKRMPPLRKSDAVLDPNPDLSAFGQQVLSGKKSSAYFGFGTATRDHKAKTFLVQTPLDKGPRATMPTPRQHHPKLAPEKEIIKHS